MGYTLLNSCLFCFAFFSKFSPATAGDIDCNLSLFNLPKDDKKAADNFFYHRLRTQVLSFNFRYIMHLRFCIYGQKNPCDFECLFRLLLRTDFNPDYLILSRFYLKNRTTIKPTPKSLIFNDFNARRGIATYNCNSMVNDGNSSVLSTKERTFRAALFMPNSTQRRITPRQHGEHMFAFYILSQPFLFVNSLLPMFIKFSK